MTILGTEGECSPRIRNEIIVIPEIERTKKKRPVANLWRKDNDLMSKNILSTLFV